MTKLCIALIHETMHIKLIAVYTEHVTVMPSPLEAVLQVVEHCLQCIVLFSMCRLCCLAISRRVSCWALETFSAMK